MQDTAPPVWLLDVDGVLNAISARGASTVWPRASWHTHRVVDPSGRAWPVLVGEPVLSYLRAVHASGAAEIRWHTTWRQSAPERLAPALGLPAWPVAQAPEYDDDPVGPYGPGAWWKVAAATRVVEDEGRRLVWTDDDLRFSAASAALAGLLRHAGVLAISPRTTIGLTRKNLLAVDEFLGTGYAPAAVTSRAPELGDGPHPPDCAAPSPVQ